MKVNLKKIGAVVAGATILASSAAFAGLMFGSTTLVDDNGAPVAKVVIGSNAQPSDGVAAALIAGKMVSEAYKTTTLTAQVSGSATCTGAEEGTGTCAISDEEVQLEITVPGSVAAGTWTGDTLIGDWINRDLEDRIDNSAITAHNSAIEYPLEAAETSDSANPFTTNEGTTTALDSAPSDVQVLYKVDGTMFTPFADATLSDDDSGNSYTETQALWLQGDTKYDTGEEELVGDIELVVYSLRFDGPGGDEVGIPICTSPEGTDYSYCKTADGDLDDATETHKLSIQFLGQDWIISEMEEPAAQATADDSLITSGGSIKLAKEAVSGILNQGESLPVDGYKFQLDDLEAHGDTTSAIISILDANGNVLEQDTVGPGETKEFNVEGELYRFHVYKIAPGYTFGAKWADVAIYSEELELVDGQELDQEVGDNEGYYVTLGWKNYDAEANSSTDGDELANDALRTIILYADTAEDVISSGEDFMTVGDYIPIVQDPVAWKLTYQGLDLEDEDYSSLTFELKTSDKDFAENKMSDGFDCTVKSPYVLVSSGTEGSVFELGTLSGNEFYVALGNGMNSTNSSSDCYQKRAGSIIMTESTASSSLYDFYAYVDQGVTVAYDAIGDGEQTFLTGGAIYIENGTDVDQGIPATGDDIGDLLFFGAGGTDGHIDYATGSANTTTMFFGIAEHAGEEYVDYFIFGVDNTDDEDEVEFQFDTDATLNTTGVTVLSDDDVLYGHATVLGTDFYNETTTVSGPVEHGIEMVEEGYISERGSVLDTFDASKVQFDMAHTLGHVEWFLASSETSTEDSSTTVWTGGEGESTTVSGVTVKVVEITETVGACSASGGTPSCTADMEGVSAVIMPNNAASVDVVTPYTGSYGNLVILDTDAVGVSTLVSVGGDKVNTVTAGLLQGTPVDWSAETKVVREVVQGSKIVVAGKEAADTLEAAADFVAQVQEV